MDLIRDSRVGGRVGDRVEVEKVWLGREAKEEEEENVCALTMF